VSLVTVYSIAHKLNLIYNRR